MNRSLVLGVCVATAGAACSAIDAASGAASAAAPASAAPAGIVLAFTWNQYLAAGTLAAIGNAAHFVKTYLTGQKNKEIFLHVS